MENKKIPKNKNYYFTDRIETWNKEKICERNTIKSNNLSTVSTMKDMSIDRVKIPVETYYFSRNLDHILFEENNLTDEEKREYARKFSMEYDACEENFISFIYKHLPNGNSSYLSSWKFIKSDNHSLFIYKHLPNGNSSYLSSWKFIKSDNHSLERFSNLFCIFKTHESQICPLAQQEVHLLTGSTSNLAKISE